MMRLVFLFVFSLSQWSVAADLDCQVSINGESYLNKGIVTELGVQKLVTRIEGTTIYVTEKRGNQFEIESFIPDYEIRMYSSGSLMAGGGPLSLSLWGRDRLIEMTCQMRAPLAP